MEPEAPSKVWHNISIIGFDFEFTCKANNHIKTEDHKWGDLSSSSFRLINLFSNSLISKAVIYLYTESNELDDKEWDFLIFLLEKLDGFQKEEVSFSFLYLSENYQCNPFLEKCIKPLRYNMFRFHESKEKNPPWDLRINIEFADFGVYFSRKNQERLINSIKRVKNFERLSELFLGIVASPEFDDKSISSLSELFNSRASNLRRWSAYLICPNVIMQKSFVSISKIKDFSKSTLTELNFTFNCEDPKFISKLCKDLGFLVGGALKKLNVMLLCKFQKSILNEFITMLNKFAMQLTRLGMSIYTEFEHFGELERKAIMDLIKRYGPQLTDLSLFSLRDDIFSQITWPLLKESLQNHKLLHLSLLTEEEGQNKNEYNLLSFAEINRYLLSFKYSIMKLGFMQSKRDYLLRMIQHYALQRKILLTSTIALENTLKIRFKRKAIIKDIVASFFV